MAHIVMVHNCDDEQVLWSVKWLLLKVYGGGSTCMHAHLARQPKNYLETCNMETNQISVPFPH
jgi:hypothetical protein